MSVHMTNFPLKVELAAGVFHFHYSNSPPVVRGFPDCMMQISRRPVWGSVNDIRGEKINVLKCCVKINEVHGDLRSHRGIERLDKIWVNKFGSQ